MAEEEKVEQVETEEEAVQETGSEEEISEEEEQKLPFPTARVVRIIKENLSREHQVRSEVKKEANELLGKILSDIAKTMDAEEYYTLNIGHFEKAARKYKTVDLQKKRFEKIKRLLEKQKAELEEVIVQLEEEEGI